jgi:hypothetical protein
MMSDYKLASRVHEQDIVAFPSVEDADRAIKESPRAIIEWLLDLLDQERR